MAASTVRASSLFRLHFRDEHLKISNTTQTLILARNSVPLHWRRAENGDEPACAVQQQQQPEQQRQQHQGQFQQGQQQQQQHQGQQQQQKHQGQEE